MTIHIKGYRVEKWEAEEMPCAEELIERMENEGFSVFSWTDQPGAVYPPHSHSEYQSHWILSGALELVVEATETVTLNAGDRDFMPAGTLHSARVLGSTPVRYLIGSKNSSS